MATKIRKTRKAPEIRFRFDSAADAKIVAEHIDSGNRIKYTRTGRTIAVAEDNISVLNSAAKREGVTAHEVAGRGRPKAGEETSRTIGVKASTKANAKNKPSKKMKVAKKVESKKPSTKIKGFKKISSLTPGRNDKKKAKVAGNKQRHSFVALFPSSADAKKILKVLNDKLSLNATQDGARVRIFSSKVDTDSREELEVRKAVKSAAHSLSIPFVLESGFKASKPVSDSKRPGAKKLKKPSERTKPVWKLEIKSSTLARAWYNVETKRLTIEFINGGKYRYENVTLKEFVAFTTAESQGVWFHDNVKDIKEFTKL